jgi:hypothetical protein
MRIIAERLAVGAFIILVISACGGSDAGFVQITADNGLAGFSLKPEKVFLSSPGKVETRKDGEAAILRYPPGAVVLQYERDGTSVVVCKFAVKSRRMVSLKISRDGGKLKCDFV